MSGRGRVLAFFVSRLGWLIVQLVGRTSRIRVRTSPEVTERLERGLPVIYAFWHRYQILLLFAKRGSGVNVLVSQSQDGELVAQALHRLGFKTVRGSSSRGGGSALKKIVGLLKSGESAAFTPDGPRGPHGTVHSGVLLAAFETGVPVVPVAWAGESVISLNSWDRMLIPRPFGRYAVVYGPLVKDLTVDVLGEEKLRIALNKAELEAQDLFKKGVSPKRCQKG